MPDLDDLPDVLDADVSDDDLFLIYDKGASSLPSRKATRAQILQGVARAGGDISLASVVIAALTATTASIATLSLNTRVTFPSGDGMRDVLFYEGNEAVPTINAGASGTIDLSVSGATTDSHVIVTFGSLLPDGMVVQAWVSAENTVQIKFYNADSSNISGASYDVKVMVVRPYIP